MSSIKWSNGKETYLLERNSSGFCDLTCSKEESVRIRRKLKEGKIADLLPFSATVTFPNKPQTAFSFYSSTLDLSQISTQVQKITAFVTGDAVPFTQEMMQIPTHTTTYSADVFAGFGKFLKTLPEEESRLFGLVCSTIRVEKICLFHFLSKNLSHRQTLAIKRQIQSSGILSKARWKQKWGIENNFGITNPDDISRNDHHYVHTYIGFPTNMNDFTKRLPESLQSKNPLKMGFIDKEGTLISPHDYGEIRNHSFTFLRKKFTIKVDDTHFTLTYFRQNKPLFSHSFHDETFYRDPKNPDSVEKGLLLILSHFINHLKEKEKVCLTYDYLLQQLFNKLFLFRTQISFPGELPYKKVEDSSILKDLINIPKVSVPDFRACLTQLRHYYETLPFTPGILNADTLNLLMVLSEFFSTQFNDGTNHFSNSFAYYGAISSQLSLHFAPEINKIFIPEVLQAIIHIEKYGSEAYEKLCHIKNTSAGTITLFSLIENGFKDLEMQQMRMPPNRPFDVSKDKATFDYTNQLQLFYTYGSPLIKSLFQLTEDEVPMIPFFQTDHVTQTLKEGIARLIHPLPYDPAQFENVHHYSPDAFRSEFNRGIDKYFESYELIDQDVICCHIEDFVHRLVEGDFLLEPCFKHDLLDLKHFTAGMFTKEKLIFKDGEASFHELILRALYAIQKQKTLSVNAQLILDTVYLFLKSQKPLVLDYSKLLPEQRPEKREYFFKILTKFPEEEWPSFKEIFLPHLANLLDDLFIPWLKEISLIDLDERKKIISFLKQLPIHCISPYSFNALKNVPKDRRQLIIDSINKLNLTKFHLNPICISHLIELFNRQEKGNYPYLIEQINILILHWKYAYFFDSEFYSLISNMRLVF